MRSGVWCVLPCDVLLIDTVMRSWPAPSRGECHEHNGAYSCSARPSVFFPSSNACPFIPLALVGVGGRTTRN
ncbi:hypothetical protein C8Q77DRAFT_1144863 [Trametes polyzona]|nr:hypothetical protein C8Q77DRAFT_1144863 [Trametes polyzona]